MWNSVVWSRFFLTGSPKTNLPGLAQAPYRPIEQTKSYQQHSDVTHCADIRAENTATLYHNVAALQKAYRYSLLGRYLFRQSRHTVPFISPNESIFSTLKVRQAKKKNESVKQSQLLNTYRDRYQYIIVRAAAKFIF